MVSILPYIGLVVLLAFSALFSGSEVAYFSLPASVRVRFASSHSTRDRIVAWFLHHPNRFLSMLLIGNTVVNTSIAIIAAFLALDIAAKHRFDVSIALAVEVVVVTIVVLLLGEITPKVLAAYNAERFASAVALILLVIAVILYPFSEAAAFLSLQLGKRIRSRTAAPLEDEEIKLLADVATERGTLYAHEREIIHGVIDFHDVKVREIMTSRVDMVAVQLTTPPLEIVELIRASGYSRVPVYKDSIDNIVGVLYAKDILKFLPNKKRLEKLDISRLLREPMFVPETTPIRALLREFQKNKIHLAIVVDEYGGTAGIITLQDILEEIVGEAEEESMNLITRISEKEFLVDGRITLDELEKELGIKLPPAGSELASRGTEYDTIAGFVLTLFGHLPHRGEEIRTDSLSISVERIQGRRIRSIRLKVISERA
jgi:CBS domain containing-hemolysin-like protein